MGVGYACQNDLLSKFNLTSMIAKARNFMICLWLFKVFIQIMIFEFISRAQLSVSFHCFYYTARKGISVKYPVMLTT